MNVLYGWVSRTARTGLGLLLILTALASAVNAGGGPPPPVAPEIDPGSIGSALTLLMGGAFLLTGRSRKA
jgi:hypothetical protein